MRPSHARQLRPRESGSILGVMDNSPTLRNLLRRRARQHARPLWRVAARLRCLQRRRAAVSGRSAAGLARPDAGSPKIRPFHATLKAPMTLAAGRNRSPALSRACELFADAATAGSLDQAGHRYHQRLHRCVIPSEPSAELGAAGRPIAPRAFDFFRAPPDVRRSRAARNPAKLTPRQLRLPGTAGATLTRWKSFAFT